MTMVNGPAPSYSAEHLVTPHSPNHTHIHTALLSMSNLCTHTRSLPK